LVEDGGSGEVEEGAWRWDSYRRRGANAGNFPARRKLADSPFPTARYPPFSNRIKPKPWWKETAQMLGCGVEHRDGICRQE
jgi:hypothetical protein